VSPPAGGYTQRVVLLSPAKTSDPVTREPSLTWTVAGEVWAAVAPLAGRRVESARQLYESATVEVRIRYRPDLIPTPGWSVYHAGRRYEIGAVLDPDMSHVELRLVCGPGKPYSIGD